jgi:biopolymer transport protein TolR
MGMSTGSRGSAMSEINVTPMVDIMLVLLIIFMITAPLIQQGVEVSLPTARAQTIDSDKELLILTLDKDRRIYIGEVQVPLPELEDKLGANAKLKKDGELFLHADRELPYGFVVEVMAISKRAGAEQNGMVTDPLDKSPGDK